MTDVPPGTKCSRDGCERQATDPKHPAGLCERHLPGHDDTKDTVERDENRHQEAEFPQSNPAPHADTTASKTDEDCAVSKYRRVYLDAAEAAGRETWEYVEEDAIRVALAAVGFDHLLEDGTLFEIRGWRVVDVSDDDEEPRRRWYYPSEREPRPDEFRRFHELLTEAAPDKYVPHYFRVAKAGKAPATQYGSWKDEDARLTAEEAVEWMQEGGNVGIAGRGGCRECGGVGVDSGAECVACGGTGEYDEYDGPLVNVDIDDDEETVPGGVPMSLRARSRSRTGWHTWYFDEEGEIPNIPTDEYGEVRANWQYVVAPGSFVASTAEEIPDVADDPGYYTVEDEVPVASVEYEDLPEVFREVAEADDQAEEDDDHLAEEFDPNDSGGEKSAVYDVEAVDLTTQSDSSNRFSSIFHDSSTGANMSVSGNKLHCWRHGVAHGGLQALATLSTKVTEGCRELGAPHTNSGAGNNRLKGDWRLVWAAWHEAKRREKIPSDDPIPYRALVGLAVEDGLVDREDLIVRDSNTGEVVADPDDHGDDTYRAFPDAGAYADALKHVRETHVVDPGREVDFSTDSDEDSQVTREETDPRELFDDPVVVEPRDAWRAAGAVQPDDLDAGEDGREISLAVIDDGDAWATPDDRRVDGVVRAVALEEGLIPAHDTDLETDTFDEAYRRARRHYGAPLPEYVDETTATDQKCILYGALDQIDHYHLDGIRSTVTDTSEGDDVAEINPAWEYSASGHRVLAFRSGWFYCREHDTSLDALRFVALEEGILDGCHDDLEGEAFLDAVDALRDRGAPVPRYDGEVIDHEAVLPEADDLLEEFTTDADRLDTARQDIEDVVEEAAADTIQADLVTALPALGKTTSTVKNAATQPTLYAAPRKELQAEVLQKAEAYGVSTYTLPVLAENHIRRDAKAEGAAAVREVGQDLLRRRDELVDRIEADIHPDPDAEDGAEDNEVDFDRATCPTANGAHGEAWQVAVQVAAELGYAPEAIHKRSKALFGEQIPCTCDDEEDAEAVACPYSEAWDRVADPDRPVDLLVGSRTHAHVPSARTWYGRDADDRVDVEPRAVAIDEFPDDAYGRRYGGEAPTIATWLGTALRDDLDTQRDVLEADVWATWVRDWVHGSASGDALPAFRHIDSRLDACRVLLDARDEVATIPPEDRPDAAEALRAAVDRGVGRDIDTADLYALADAALASVREADALPGSLTGELKGPLDDLRAALGDLDGSIGEAYLVVDGDRLGETLHDVVDTALEGALVAGEDHALEAARDVCRGGEAGTRALAVHADDPYAHPDAYLLLAGMVGEGEVVRTQQFRFDPNRPRTHLTRTCLDGATVLFDRDHDGAYVLDPPEFVDTAGRDCPVVGLDATGRETLWSLALGEDVDSEIFTTALANAASSSGTSSIFKWSKRRHTSIRTVA